MNTLQAYQEKLQAKMDEWKADLDKLTATAQGAVADEKIKSQQKIDELKMKHSAAAEKMEELKLAGESKWHELQAGIDSLLGND